LGDGRSGFSTSCTPFAAGAGRGPTGFVSKTTLPAGEPYRVVVQVRATPDAKPQNFRLDLNLALCGECQRAEYACTCDH
jgi:hypothetical protein